MAQSPHSSPRAIQAKHRHGICVSLRMQAAEMREVASSPNATMGHILLRAANRLDAMASALTDAGIRFPVG